MRHDIDGPALRKLLDIIMLLSHHKQTDLVPLLMGKIVEVAGLGFSRPSCVGYNDI